MRSETYTLNHGSVLLESSLLFSSFFLSRRTEAPQCSGQACFDEKEGREERGNRERGDRETGQESGKTGIRVDLRQHKEKKKDREEAGRGMPEINGCCLPRQHSSLGPAFWAFLSA